MTKARKNLLIFSLVLMLLGVAYYLLRFPTEPAYAGKTLSDWVKGYRWSFGSPTGIFGDQEANNAIRNIGTNALPTLLEWIQFQPTPKRLEYSKLRFYLGFLLSSSPRPPTSKPEFHHQDLAPHVFFILGPQMKEAVPKLNHLMISHSDAKVVERAAVALGYLGHYHGPEVAPLLLSAVTNQQTHVRRAARSGLVTMGSNAPPAVLPLLVQALGEPDDAVGSQAINAMSLRRQDSKRLLPVLLPLLQDTNWRVRCKAASALSALGTNAQPAVPALLSLYHAPLTAQGRVFERGFISNVLNLIDPQALSRQVPHSKLVP